MLMDNIIDIVTLANIFLITVAIALIMNDNFEDRKMYLSLYPLFFI